MKGLLAHLVPRFTAHPENLATEALAYILRKSQTARLAFVHHLAGFVPDLPQALAFRTQAAGDDNAIPDLIGADDTGRQLVVAEAKFWAGLTEHQPLTYLQRLPRDCPGLVISGAAVEKLRKTHNEGKPVPERPGPLLGRRPSA